MKVQPAQNGTAHSAVVTCAARRNNPPLLQITSMFKLPREIGPTTIINKGTADTPALGDVNGTGATESPQ
jgi:hypothetical protein